MVRFMPCPLYPKNPMDRRLGGPQNHFGRYGEEKRREEKRREEKRREEKRREEKRRKEYFALAGNRP
jgi:hypothetical protein